MTQEKEVSGSLASISKRFSLNIGDHLYKRLMRHIRALKHLIPSYQKVKWIETAIQEKLERDKNLDLEDLNQKSLHMHLSPEIYEEIERQVEFIKKFRKHYSKKQWIVDAFYEKLDRDEIKVKQQIEEKMKS